MKLASKGRALQAAVLVIFFAAVLPLAHGQSAASWDKAQQQKAKDSSPAAVSSPSGPATSTAAASKQDTGSYKGVTRCAADLMLALPVAGRIAEVLVREGAVVREGQELLHLDRDGERLDTERRRLQWESKAELETALARKNTAEMQAKAARQIYETTRGISREELENRELAHATTTAELERVKTTKEMERLDYLIAKESLERRSLRAPTRGIVSSLIKQKGESVQANDPVLRLCDLSKIQFVTNVPYTQTASLREGSLVKLNVGFNPVPLQGRIVFISPVVDSASGLREIKIDLINPSREMRPGVPASLELGG